MRCTRASTRSWRVCATPRRHSERPADPKPSEPLRQVCVALFWQSQQRGRSNMPRGDKSSYTSKQKRKAEHIEEGYEKRGVSKDEAERRAWATVNKETGGGNKSGSGRG